MYGLSEKFASEHPVENSLYASTVPEAGVSM